MRGPNGEQHDSTGCYLEIVPREKLVFTDALLLGYRPSEKPFFTGIILLEDAGTATKYTAIAKHRDQAGKDQHEARGFHKGWGAALDQLVALMKR